MADIQRQLDELRETVYGNGTEGLKIKMTRVEMTLETLVESRRETKKWLMGIAATVVGAAIVAAGTQLWNAAKISATNDLVMRATKQLNDVAHEVAPSAAMPEPAGK